MNPSGGRWRVAALTSHPIQYQAPLFRALTDSGKVDLHVFFCSSHGTRHHHDKGFRTQFQWDIPLLDGYRHSFLANLNPGQAPARFLGCVNPGVVRALTRREFDAVWVHGWALASCWLGFWSAHRRGIPLLLRGETNGLSEPAGVKRAAKHLLLTRLFRNTSAFLAVGANNAEFYASYGVPREKIFVAPYSVDNRLFLGNAIANSEAKRRLRKREGIDPDLPVVLYCGKFVDYKRPIDLLDAFRQLGDTPKASLAFVGDGPLRTEMQSYVAAHGLQRVHFLGFRNQKQLAECYALADTFVLPSSFEQWGLVLNEAMCAGLPVITSDQVGAARDLVHDGVNGFVFPAGRCDLLAERLRTLLFDADRRSRMGAESLAMIQHWGIDDTVSGILAALEYVSAQPGA